MPELPEVETIKRDLKKIIGAKIVKIEILDKKVVSEDIDVFIKKFQGKIIENIFRIGKLIILKFNEDLHLLIHLKMTGQLIYCLKGKLIAGGHALQEDLKIPGVGDGLPNKHTRAIISLSDKNKIYFNDLRRFGYLKSADRNELKKKEQEFGPDPLSKNFNLKYFKEKTKHRKINIKQFLLNQKIVAGIGNIYADEILFRARIHPLRKAGTLKDKELDNLVKSSKIIISKAIKYRGTTFSNYVDSKGKKGNYARFLRVYGKNAQKCPICTGSIQKIKINGRGTHFCPN